MADQEPSTKAPPASSANNDGVTAAPVGATAPSTSTGAPVAVNTTQNNPTSATTVAREDAIAGSRLRSASLRFLESSPPSGFMAAAGHAAAKAPSLKDIRRGSFTHSGWDSEGQRRNSVSDSLKRTGSREAVTTLSRTTTTETPIQQRSPPLQSDVVAESPNERDEDLPANMVGRGEITDQSRDRSSKTPNFGTDIDPSAHKIEATDKATRALNGSGDTSDPPESAFPPKPVGPDENGVYATGYKFPPKHTWTQSFVIGIKGLWKFTLTIQGFLIVLYGLNVVAWGGMLFLLLCNAGPAMCYSDEIPGIKDCDFINSPRRVWIEIDSQILNALFCVTAFGLVPWRFRDLYYLLRFRIQNDTHALRWLAGIHNGWFRLPGSDRLPATPQEASTAYVSGRSGYEDPDSVAPEDTTFPPPTDAPVGAASDDTNNPAVPLPLFKAPPYPLTGIRAPPTAVWKLDYVIWMFVANTALQVVLCVFMWGFNRFARPSWSTGLFVALGCIVAILAGLMIFYEGKHVKAVEGVPVQVAEVIRDAKQKVGPATELGIIDVEKANGLTKI